MLVSCQRVPKNIIQPDDMAELLADIHTAEGVVEINYGAYTSDSAKQALKQAVLAKHGVSQDDLDTAFMWYGNHLDRYMDIYAETEEILQERIDRNDAVQAAAVNVSVAGDSVNVWSGARRYMLTPGSPTHALKFDLKRDKNWKKGDMYTLRGKFFNAAGVSHWGMVAEYADTVKETFSAQFSGDGWHEMTFFTDSTRVLKRFYGYTIVAKGQNRTPVFIDSIELVRSRVNPERYVQRYRQRLFDLRK